jgi:hypothetical protein
VSNGFNVFWARKVFKGHADWGVDVCCGLTLQPRLLNFPR